MTLAIDFGTVLMSDAGGRNPYPTYRRMRAEAPIHWSEVAHCWFVTRYVDVLALLSHPALGARSKTSELPALPPVFHRVEAFLDTWIAFCNPPNHSRRQAAIRDTIRPTAIVDLQGSLRTIAGSLVVALPAGTCELRRDFVDPFVLRSVCLLLGVSEHEQTAAARAAEDILAYLRAGGWITERAVVADDAIRRLRDLICDSVLPRGGSHFARRLQASLADGTLSEAEAVGAFAQFLTGGIEPTTTAILTAAQHLLSEVGAGRQVDHATMPNVVSEALRFNPPFHVISRTALTPFRLHGCEIQAGDIVKLLIGSANRDDAQFERADEFVVSERARDGLALAFGRGLHACLGAGFARLQIETALSTLWPILPALRLDGDPVPGGGFGMGTFLALPIRHAISP